MNILKYQIFVESALLKLSNNTDMDLINKIESLIKPPAKILEIACGNSSDAIYLKSVGFNITCTDENIDYVNNAIKNGLVCIKHDTTDKFPFSSKSFDLVYSRLGLHYFTEDQLYNIFDEISRIGKYVVFTVKITNDILKTGKIILTPEKWVEIVSKNFDIISRKEQEGILYDNMSNWLEIVAKSKR